MEAGLWSSQVDRWDYHYVRKLFSLEGCLFFKVSMGNRQRKTLHEEGR